MNNTITKEDILKNGVGAKYRINPEFVGKCTNGGEGAHRHHITITQISPDYETGEGRYYYTVHRENGEVCGSCSRVGCYEEYTLLPFEETPEEPTVTLENSLQNVIDVAMNPQKHIAQIDTEIAKCQNIIKENQEIITKLSEARVKLLML